MIDLDDSARLRRGGPEDLEVLLAIRARLPMPAPEPRAGAAQTRRGGFLLGSDPQTYARLLQVASVWVLEVEGAPAGFTLTLADPVLRASPLWARREAIDWSPELPLADLSQQRIAYFDQLAVLPSNRCRYWGAALALRALDELFDPQAAAGGHDLVLTTTVLEPIANRAALPLLARVGARHVGNLDERYPEVGRVVSALHLIEKTDYRRRVAAMARGVDVGAGAGAGVRRLIASTLPTLQPGSADS